MVGGHRDVLWKGTGTQRRWGGCGDTLGGYRDMVGTCGHGGEGHGDPEVVGSVWGHGGGHGDRVGPCQGGHGEGTGTLREGSQGCHLCPPQGVSLELRPGEVLAVVAPPGAGKSTLVSLVLRLCPPGAGRVLLDGHPLPAYQHRNLRCQVPPLPRSRDVPNGSPLLPPCHQLSPPRHRHHPVSPDISATSRPCPHHVPTTSLAMSPDIPPMSPVHPCFVPI